MLVKTQGIVVYKVKYSETSLIFHMLTRDLGVRAFIAKGVRSKKSKISLALFDYMNTLDVVASLGSHADLHVVREIDFASDAPFQTLDPVRNSILMFLAEFIHKSMVKSVPDESLYHFVDHSMRIFFQHPKPIADFHLWFITKISRFLGIIPVDNYDATHPQFSICQSRFIHPSSQQEALFSISSSQLLHYYLSVSIEDLAKKSIPLEVRNQFLDEMLFYYRYHQEHFHGLKSHEILKSVFR